MWETTAAVEGVGPREIKNKPAFDRICLQLLNAALNRKLAPFFSFSISHTRAHARARFLRARTRRQPATQSAAQQPSTVPASAVGAPCFAPLPLRWTFAQRILTSAIDFHPSPAAPPHFSTCTACNCCC